MPSAAHFIYIPATILLGIVLGFVLAGRAARAAAAEKEERDRRIAERANARARVKDEAGSEQ